MHLVDFVRVLSAAKDGRQLQSLASSTTALNIVAMGGQQSANEEVSFESPETFVHVFTTPLRKLLN